MMYKLKYKNRSFHSIIKDEFEQKDTEFKLVFGMVLVSCFTVSIQLLIRFTIGGI